MMKNFAEDLAGTHRHRTVEKYREVGNPVSLFQAMDMVEDRLNPAHGEGRDQDHAAAPRGADDDVGQDVFRVFRAARSAEIT